jgi:hypothetical protein
MTERRIWMSNKDGSEPPLHPDLLRGAWLTLIMIGGFLAVALWMIIRRVVW